MLGKFLKIIDEEPEYPGEVPDSLYQFMLEESKGPNFKGMLHALLRRAVIDTKKSIRDRLLCDCGAAADLLNPDPPPHDSKCAALTTIFINTEAKMVEHLSYSPQCLVCEGKETLTEYPTAKVDEHGTLLDVTPTNYKCTSCGTNWVKWPEITEWPEYLRDRIKDWKPNEHA